jgi:cellulose synthase/poly-beta-1,6-N-acetylglucosamine synthase-like glycosyltransferase
MFDDQFLFQIIVPVFNEEETLEQVLSYAKANDYLKHIVFVDDASRDSSPRILREWSEKEGVRAISLKNNCRKEGAIRAVMEVLEREHGLAPYTVLLDSDSLIARSVTHGTLDSRIERAIAYMKDRRLGGMAFQIDAISHAKMNIFSYGAFADYAAMQFDQWLVGKQQQLWVINGPGGIFETRRLLYILRSIVPDFETGDLLITVELMKDNQPIEFYPDISVDTFVPTTLKAYFNQRRRWERGTTKVLWNERKFYTSLFCGFSLLALLTTIHLSLHFALLASFIMVLSNSMAINDFFRVIVASLLIWFVISVLKGLWLKCRRKDFPFFRYCLCAVGNGMLWTIITTIARIIGFWEGVVHLITNHRRAAFSNSNEVEFSWLAIEKRAHLQ